MLSGSLLMSAATNELELHGHSFPGLGKNERYRLSCHNDDGEYCVGTCSVLYQTPSIVGFKEIDEVFYEKLCELLQSNINFKCFAKKKQNLFKSAELKDVSVYRIERLNDPEKGFVFRFTSIEKLEIGSKIIIDATSPINLQKLELSIVERINLRGAANSFKATTEKITKNNNLEINFYLSGLNSGVMD